MTVFKLMRIVALLSILFVLVVGAWMTEKRLASWDRPAWVSVYPIIADETAKSIKYVESVDASTFAAVNEFMARQIMPYGISVSPGSCSSIQKRGLGIG